MTVTIDPVNQLTGGGKFPHEDCGEACVTSIVIDDGKAENIGDVERWDNTHRDWPGDGTGGNVVVSKLASLGIPSRTFSDNVLGVVAAGQRKGLNRWMLAIWSDHGGNPQPRSGIGHWLLTSGINQRSSTFHCMQPVGGRIVDYSTGSIAAAQQFYGVEVLRPIGRSELATISAGSNNMWIAKKVFLMPNGVDGLLLDGWGGLHPIGNMPPPSEGPYWPRWDIARDLVVHPNYEGGYVLDGFGGIHPFKIKGPTPPAPPKGSTPYWPNFDVAVELILLNWDLPSGWVVDGWGGMHTFGGTHALSGGGYWPGGQPG